MSSHAGGRARARDREGAGTRAGLLAMTAMLLLAGAAPPEGPARARAGAPAAPPGSLPAPERTGTFPLEKAIAGRRSVREFAPTPLTAGELSQLLWAAQGVTAADGRRSAPSAGALYPLELYVATASGLDHYEPGRHRLRRLSSRDLRADLRRAALGQAPLGEAPAVFVITALFERTERKYGPGRGARYVHLEAGHAAQNLLLEAVALGLAGVPIGAFDDDRVARALALPAGERPLYLVPAGRPRAGGAARP